MPFRLRFRSSRPSAEAEVPTASRHTTPAVNASGFGPEPDRWATQEADLGVSLDDVARQLTQRTLLLPLSLAQARVVVGYMKPLALPAQHTFAGPDCPQTPTDLMLIVQGEVKQRTLVQGRAMVCDVAMGLLGPGDFVSETVLLDGGVRNVSFETLTPVVLATLSRGALATLDHDHPDLAARLMSAVCLGLSQRLRANHRRITDASGAVRDMQDRLLHIPPAR